MQDNQKLILPFTEIRATDLPSVGGKGANLGELTHAGFPVPPGFCLTTTAFQQFIDACPEKANLYDLLATVTAQDVETARAVGQQVRETLLAVPMPQEIADAVGEEWRQLGQDHAYAVRSSATAEDLPDASFAGQQDTYLNVCGEAALLDAIRRCWVSLFTDRAILYRCQNNFSHQDVLLSVVVQQMIMAETSGILFTADPLTGHRHTLSIDASFGLGEALVSGLVSPDAYRVDKREQTIIDRQIAHKEIAIYPEKEGGVRQVDLPAEQQDQTVLTDDQILELAAMGTRIESHYGTPQDIEWAIANGQHYLLQARPITSLYPIDGLQPNDDGLHIYFSMGHQQMMTNAMSPLGISTMRAAVPGKRMPNEIESSVARANGGRLFANITPILRHPVGRKIILAVMSQFDALGPEAVQIAMQRPEFQHIQKHSGLPSLALLRNGFYVFRQVIASLWWRNLTGSAEDANQVIDQHLTTLRAELDAMPVGQEQMHTMLAALRAFPTVMLNWIPRFIAGQIAQRLIERLGHGWADPADLEVYNLGLPGNVVTEMNLAVGDLANVARSSPQLVAHFERLADDSQTWLREAAALEDSAPFMEAWQGFMAGYGMRGPSEIDIHTPRWYEEPLPLLQVIANHLKQEKGAHRIHHQKLVQGSEEAINNLRAAANHGLLGGLRSRLIRRLLHVVEHGSVLREHHKFMVVQMMGIIKGKVKETAQHLTKIQKLATPDDVWFLTWPELLAVAGDDALTNQTDISALVATRRANLERFQKMTPPVMLTSDGETPVVKYEVTDAPPGALVGNPVSAGVVEGVARVIHDPQTETLNPGEILVAAFTDPGWTPLFINAAGLITEVGGAMTHGSVVAREYSIPAVVGVRGATTSLESGQRVRVDGNRGVVEVL